MYEKGSEGFDNLNRVRLCASNQKLVDACCCCPARYAETRQYIIPDMQKLAIFRFFCQYIISDTTGSKVMMSILARTLVIFCSYLSHACENNTFRGRHKHKATSVVGTVLSYQCRILSGTFFTF
jgi:hypothetical protein